MSVRPAIGVLCCNERHERDVQVVASRFIAPLSRIAQADVFLIPAMADLVDTASMAARLDGLLLTGSRSHVAPSRYGGETALSGTHDEQRDEVALALAGRMVEAGRPVFGICRGFQEINVLFGGSLSSDVCDGRHHRGHDHDDGYDALFDHAHDVELLVGGTLARAAGTRRLRVNSVHEQGIDRLGNGLTVEAVATDDGLIEAISARPRGSLVLGVQWHPEWKADAHSGNRAFFSIVGDALRGGSPTAH